MTIVAEYSGIQTSACVDDDTLTGNEDGADTDPLTGATLTASAAALLVGVGVSNVALASDNLERREGASTSNIQMNMGDKRLTGAGTDALTWDFAGTAPTLSLSMMLKEVAGGAASFVPAIINQGRGGEIVAWVERLGLVRPHQGIRLVQTVVMRGRR